MEPQKTVSTGGVPPVMVGTDIGAIRRILVANGKGGCGKTTIATNLASYFSLHGQPAALLDYDPQGSSTQWLSLRERAPVIHGVCAHRHSMVQTRVYQMRLPEWTRRVILDAPAGVGGPDLLEMVRQVDTVLIPVLPSPFDIHAAAHFIRDLLLVGRVRANAVRVGVIANRVRRSTLVYRSLRRFLDALEIPFVGQIRDTQNYLHAAQEGLGVCELPGARRDVGDWRRIVEWIEAD